MQIGVDMEKNQRFIRLLTKPYFMNRVFTPTERVYIAQKTKGAHRTACGIFCVKEAFGKAIGTGIDLNFQQVCVDHSSSGMPTLTLTGKYAHLKANISISHTDDTSIGFCILE